MNFIKRIPLFEALIFTAILCTHLYAALSDAYNLPNAWFMRDDAYYYFKVAQNITEGHGSTFDGINTTNGYHPLWMLVCIPVFVFARYDVILPLRILLMVIAVLNAATAILIYRLVKRHLSHAVAMLAASFWAFNTKIYMTVYMPGLETPLAAFAIVLLMYKLSQFEKKWRTAPVTPRQLGILALCAMFAMFSRLDLVFLAAIVGIWVILRGRIMRVLLPLDVLVIFVSMTCSIALRTGMEQYNSTYAASAVEAVLLVLIIKIPALYFLGVYQHPRKSSILSTLQRTGIAITVGSGMAAVAYLLLLQLGIGRGFPRSAFLIDWGLSLLLTLLLRLAVHWFGDSKITPGAGPSPFVELRSNWRKWLSEGLVYYGVVGGALGLYMLYNKLAFGTTSPVSGQIKRWWGTLINTVYESPAPDWTSFLGISFSWAYDAWQPASSLFLWMANTIKPLFPRTVTTGDCYYASMLAVIVMVVVVLFANARRTRVIFSNMALIPLAAGCGIQILSYTTTAYGGAKEWYWVGEAILVTLAGSVLLDFILRSFLRLSRKSQIPIRVVFEFASAAICLLLVYRFGYEVWAAMRYNYFPPDRPYMEVLPYLEENTPPGAVIGMTGGGNVGYFIHDRTIVNMDGLINSYDYFRALQNGQAAPYLRERGITIVFASPRLLGLPPYNGQFAPYFENFSQYGGKNLMYLLEEPKY